MDAIATHDLTKVYRAHLGRRAAPSLNGLTLNVQENEVFGFLGRNGAGKTTTIKILCGLLRATRGSAALFGELVHTRRSRRLIGYLPENPYFYEYLNPRETLDFYGRLHGLDAAARAAEWRKLSELLDLGDIADQRVRGFSKGMRQRLGFAVAMVGDPPLLILDEPMSGLDPLGRRHIRELMLRLRDEKKTLFFSSHVLGDVEQVCERVGILVKGKLTAAGRIEDLLQQHVHQVEIILDRVDDGLGRDLAARASGVRHSEAGQHFTVSDADAADALVRDALNRGARLIEYTPVRDSLEEYFMRHQEGRS